MCKGCALDKHANIAFSSSGHTPRDILDLSHLDLCGPLSLTSLIGNLYYASFVDDSSVKSWIYFMKNKNKVFSKFQEFKALVENQAGGKIKVLRFDNGGDYTSKDFGAFCRETRIKRELTMPYNSQ